MGFGYLKPLDDSGERLLMVRINGEISIVNYVNGKVISKIEIAGEPVAATCSPSSRRLFLLTDDSTVHCITWDQQLRLSVLGTLAFGNDEGFVFSVPDGYFTGTGPGGKLSLSLGTRAIPL